MKTVTVLIIRTAGTNCDRETGQAFELAGARTNWVHVNVLLQQPQLLSSVQIVALPGGFTYGDDIAAGKILANELRQRLQDPLRKFVADGGLLIGICNGFQVLVKMGMLPDSVSWRQQVTLGHNDSARFEARWVHLRPPPGRGARCVWTQGLPERIYLPVAHGEGKFICADPSVAAALEENSQIVLQYCDAAGALTGYPGNPNGSQLHAAGICDQTGRVLGLMPHPERFVRRTQHPHWTRLGEDLVPDGLRFFENAVRHLKRT